MIQGLCRDYSGAPTADAQFLSAAVSELIRRHCRPVSTAAMLRPCFDCDTMYNLEVCFPWKGKLFRRQSRKLRSTYDLTQAP